MEKTEPNLGLEAMESEGDRKRKVYIPGGMDKEASLNVR